VYHAGAVANQSWFCNNASAAQPPQWRKGVLLAGVGAALLAAWQLRQSYHVVLSRVLPRRSAEVHVAAPVPQHAAGLSLMRNELMPPVVSSLAGPSVSKSSSTLK